MNRHYILFIACLLFSASTIQAQIAQLNPKIVTVRQYEKEANKAFEIRDYNSALEYYLIILKDQPARTDLFWNTAESARQTRHYTVAYKYFESLNQSDLAKNYPQLTFKRAMVKKSLGEYEGAVTLFKAFIAGVPIAGTTNANDLIKEAQAEIEACEWAKPIAESTPTYDLVHLDNTVNSNYTDIAPVQHNNTLYYTSAYFEEETAKPVTRIYRLDTKGKPELLDINSTVKDEYTAHFALNTEGSRVYYNIGTMRNKTDFHAEIYYRDKDANGSWKAPVRLPDTINTQMYTATQPNIGFDKATGREVLYFVSDRPGGKGGLDIWYSDIDAQGNFGIPKNLSDVNTAKDDITPFYFNKAQILFFSTEGYKTMGGFDVFYVNKNETSNWSTPTPGGFPLNSSYDETYYSISGETGRSYFVSNRKGGNCISPDKDCVCNDIYNYDIKLDLKAETFLATTGEALKGCQVELYDVDSKTSIKLTLNNEGNNFDFPLDLNKNYRLIGMKEGHIPDTAYFNTNGIWQTTTIYKRLELKPNLKLNVYVFDKISKAPLEGARVDMREASTGKLVLSEILIGNSFTTNKIEFGKSYWLYGTKETYDSDSSLLVIDAYGTSKRYEYSDSLYLKPFSGLPLTLFFDDDHPNPRTWDSLTYLTYDDTYKGYILKEREYLSAFYGANPNVSFAKANEISIFFSDSIKNHYKKLMDFSELLVKYMKIGKTVEIAIEGFASPLADSVYNKLLTSRRIKSLINHFYEYDNKALLSYINDKKLLIKLIPYGETKARKGVSDDFNDKRNSIYSISAMRERKVEIKDIKQLTDEEIKSLSYYDPKASFNSYWDFDRQISFLGKSITPEASLEGGKSLTQKGAPKTGTSVPSDIPTSYSKGVKLPQNSAAKQRHEFVLVDSYTGAIISNDAEVKAFEANNEKNSDKAKRKGSNYRIDLAGNKNYIVKGSALGYSTSSSTLYGNNVRREGVDVVRDTLFLTPFNGLPLPLYFNNDRPDPNTTKVRATESYNKSFKEYYDEKRNFISQYTQLLAKNGSVPMAVNEMEQFFDEDVKVGFEKMTGFVSIMKTYLRQGKRLDVIIEGYASPLANASYNEYLTSRRINSVVKFLSTYSGGSLSKYIKNGQLTLRIRPLGESEAATNVSDDNNDPIRSIYSLEASKERRVVIKDVIIRQD